MELSVTISCGLILSMCCVMLLALNVGIENYWGLDPHNSCGLGIAFVLIWFCRELSAKPRHMPGAYQRNLAPPQGLHYTENTLLNIHN